MKAKYVPLVGDEEHGQERTTTSSVLSKLHVQRRKWIYGGAILSIILVSILLSSSMHRLSSSPEVPASLDPFEVPASFDPLLGKNEDVVKLWYPPTETDKRLQIPIHSSADWLKPLRPRFRTPLFIGFTRANAMIQQTVLSYLAAGWPREDIIIVDYSGTFDANSEGQLTPDNPFFLDYHLFRDRYGVAILQTPTLLSFAQLMNFYLRTSMAHNWQYFFWSHMDVAVLSDETPEPYEFLSFHDRVLGVLANEGATSLLTPPVPIGQELWALKYFSYDWLTLINVEAFRTIGSWDPFIPYYNSDCDMYSRIAMHGFTKEDVRAGMIFDLPSAITDPELKFLPQPEEITNEADSYKLNSTRYRALVAELEVLQSRKKEGHRNEWQGKANGGLGEPWTYSPLGFQKMWWETAGHGRALYELKWGSKECRLDEQGMTLTDEWRDIDKPTFGG